MNAPKSIALVALAALLAGALAGCERIGEPWDRTGYFEQERKRSEALDSELRQRARQQADRTYG